ncbi:hypothetical protein CA51_25010 [Rosistilla oblonga]|uniref:hypothetical protein n=1 Tax=Rosistilla oblonga TaxID=2527990 RepID=UPI00118A1A2F|nr:hypothetical protein [Rosistilla oblonga]QDV12615.1 hypothetical protein CA51_25010 [Rosistilla oblonga]
MRNRDTRFSNIFVLGTGRCGTVSFFKACRHIKNYSAGHETRSGSIGPQRLNYPHAHIEADNRLTWFLGRMDRQFGNDAYYVHLRRDPIKTAESFAKRYTRGIIAGYRSSVLLNPSRSELPIDVCLDYVETVTDNVSHFLKDKSHQIEMDIDRPDETFGRFWSEIGAQGDDAAAMQELRVRHNASPKLFSRVGLTNLAFSICPQLNRLSRCR